MNLKSAEITQLLDKVFDSKFGTAETNVDAGYMLIRHLLEYKLNANVEVVLVDVPDENSLADPRLLSGLYKCAFGDADHMLDRINPAYISVVIQEEDMRSWHTIWFDDKRKLVVEFDGYMYANAYLYFIKEK